MRHLLQIYDEDLPASDNLSYPFTNLDDLVSLNYADTLKWQDKIEGDKLFVWVT